MYIAWRNKVAKNTGRLEDGGTGRLEDRGSGRLESWKKVFQGTSDQYKSTIVSALIIGEKEDNNK